MIEFLIEHKMSKNNKSIYGLPAKSYTDQQFWEIECNTVLADGWLFVGFLHELLNSGDVIPISIDGKPILLVKNNKDKSFVFPRDWKSHNSTRNTKENNWWNKVNMNKTDYNRKCFNDEAQIQNHIKFIEEEIKRSVKDSRMLELKNWLDYLKAA